VPTSLTTRRPDEIVDQAYTQIQKWAVAAAANLEKICLNVSAPL
jgi:hypothetical protein